MYWFNDEDFQGGNVTALNLSAVNTLTRTWGDGALGGIEVSDTLVATSLLVAGVNDAPTTAPVVLVDIAEDSGVWLITQAHFLGQASDPDGSALTATGLVISAGNGTLSNNENGAWKFHPGSG